MPFYEYKREDGTTFTKRQSIKEEPLEECPETGQKCKRYFAKPSSFILKGEGFYVNDYGKG